jgi:PilZ domain
LTDLAQRPSSIHEAGAFAGPRPTRKPAPLRDADRRSALRYPSIMGRCWLGWHAGRDFPRLPAFLIDLSSGGCLLAADDEPPESQPVLLRLDGPLLPLWFSAHIRTIRRSALGVRAIHLGFPDGCAYELFMGAVYGRFERPS